MTSSAPLGLRERKRRDVRARIEAAALLLVLRDGLDATTVDAISEQADVSPRTFFNYFDTKDSAILGLHHRDLTDEREAEHLQGGGRGLVASVVALVLVVVGVPTSPSAALHRQRMEVIRRHPGVLGSRAVEFSARTEWLVDKVQELITGSPASLGADSDLRAEAEVLLALCAGATRVAVHEWAAADTPTAVQDIERRAVALIERIGELT